MSNASLQSLKRGPRRISRDVRVRAGLPGKAAPRLRLQRWVESSPVRQGGQAPGGRGVYSRRGAGKPDRPPEVRLGSGASLR